MIATFFMIFSLLFRGIHKLRQSEVLDEQKVIIKSAVDKQQERLQHQNSAATSYSYDKISVFSRSDSAATTASIEQIGCKNREDSSVSTNSTSCSDVPLPEGRRSSEGARIIIGGQRRQIGRLRRYAPRLTSGGNGRRRTTGR